MKRADQLRNLEIRHDFEKAKAIREREAVLIKHMETQMVSRAMEGKKNTIFESESNFSGLEISSIIDIIDYFETLGYKVTVYMMDSETQVMEIGW